MNKQKNRNLRRKRVRAKVYGTAKRPRLSVSISLKHVRVQLIDDETGKTIISASDLKSKDKKTKVEKAKLVGKQIAKKAKEKKIKEVVFDRSHKIYHGRVKALAESARKQGLKF